MTMTLRRCDSLPTRLPEAPVPTKSRQTPQNQLPDSITVPNFCEGSEREEVIATWKSLYTDIKNIKNGFPANDLPNHGAAKKESITHNFIPAFSCNNKNVARRITYDNRQTRVIPRVAERCSSFSLDTGQVRSTELGANRARRRTLLQRLLSWRTPDCDCTERCPRPYRQNDLCTCCDTRVNKLAKCNKYAERGRSKSVGYEAAREVTRFRRCASAGATVGVETAAALRARAALTLARRYYPEGGWGWTITIVGTIVQVISHGLQLGGGTGAIACTAASKYRVPPLYTHG
ncbi:uncharacterized protein [Choristoneura fumiferana]